MRTMRKGIIMPGKGYRLRAQGVSFGVVGLSGTALNASLVYLLHGLLHWPLPVAVALASELAIFNNYHSNDRWTFGRRALSLQHFVRFNLSSLARLSSLRQFDLQADRRVLDERDGSAGGVGVLDHVGQGLLR